MSTASKIAYAGLTAARSRLQALANGLRAAAGGEVVEEAAQEVGGLVRKVASTKLSAHEMSGAAASLTVVDVAGGLVELHGMPPCNGKQWEGSSYVGTKKWWPFRGGVMPPFILKQAGVIFARKLLAKLGAEAGGDAGDLAIEVVAAADAAETKALDRKIKSQERRQERREAAAHRREQAKAKKVSERAARKAARARP